jgi:hypothetical protein
LYSNNETSVPGCVPYIGKDNTSARTTGPHIHVIYTGGSVDTTRSGVEREGSVGPKRGAVLKGSFDNPEPSPGIQAMVNKMKSENKKISKVVVTGTGGSNATIAFYIQGYNTPAATIPNIKIGRNGLSPASCGVGTRCADDEATPRGTYVLGHPGERWDNPSRTPYLANGDISMGLAVYNFIPSRDIHLHGTRNDTQEVTKGCIRLSNDDIIVVGPYFVKGVTTIEIK